ncbi:MAG: hypothetical protein DHS20C02_12060 [Micavibrio sp.]|nr:MAG: hypothetical protein DHS20C02_12060 [Micavibrio sp.]
MDIEKLQHLAKLANKMPKRMTEVEVAECLSLSRKTLQRWRKSGEGPPFIRIGRSIRYPADELEAWLTKRTHR